jgi:Cof subfamily protein (haloacid dehalogenase superfamily)
MIEGDHLDYKFIAADLDGTLLNSRGQLSEQTVRAILKAKEKGLHFTLCTGRPVQGITHFIDILQLSGFPMVTYNGAMIIRVGSNEVLCEQKMNPEDSRNVLSLGKKLKTTVITWSDNKLYAHVINEAVRDYQKISDVLPELITNEEALIRRGITKILWIDDADQIKRYQGILSGQLGTGVTYCTSKPSFLEFFDSRVSKASALKTLAGMLGISREEIIAIGDGYNDLPMIEYAGLGVAMGNAPEDLKSRADCVTLSNDEDGVACFLNDLFS